MKRHLFLLLMFIFCKLELNAQTKCSFDSIYPTGIIGGAYKIIQLKDGNFLTSGMKLNYSAPPGTSTYQIFVSKIESCGKIIWTFYDTSSFDIPQNISNLIEEEDNSITFVILKRLIKLDPYGNIIWNKIIGNGTIIINSKQHFIKFDINRYLWAGRIQNSARVLMIDSNGTVLFEKEFFVDSTQTCSFDKVYKKSSNQLLLLGIDNKGFFSIKMDSIGNFQNNFYLNFKDSLVPIYKNVSLNYDSTQIQISTIVLNKLYVARYTLNGIFIIDTLFNYSGYNTIYPAFNNSSILMTQDKVFLVDSNYQTSWSKSIIQPPGKELYLRDAILTKDGSIFEIGEVNYTFIARLYQQLYASKTVLYPNTGIEKLLQNSISTIIYPNPASQYLSISLQNNHSEVQFEIFDAKGQQIKNIQFDKINEQLYNLDIKDFEEGIYLLSVSVNESKIYRKVIVVK